MKHRYTREQLASAISQSTSIRQALVLLGVAPQGGNYKIIHNAIAKWGINTSHFTGQAHAKGKVLGPKVPIHEYLRDGTSIGSDRLRKRLLRDGIMSYQCSCCGNTEWNNQPIPLELDHIDGKHDNNELSNLRLLCPNCHAQTHTYRGKNKKPLQI